MNTVHLRRCVRNALQGRQPSLGAWVLAATCAGLAPLASASAFPPEISALSLYRGSGGDGSVGFVLAGPDTHDLWRVGRSVSSGDFNGDGIDDLVVGAPYAGEYGGLHPGAAFVLFGSPAGFPAQLDVRRLLPNGGGDGSRGFVLEGTQDDSYTAHSVSNAGDVNGDGIDDLVIGAERAKVGSRVDAGESFVVFGSRAGFPAVLSLSSLLPPNGGDGSRGFVMQGVRRDDASGASVRNAGDINGDGIGDLVVGAVYAGEQPAGGECFIVFGATQFPAVLQLASLLPPAGGDGTRGFVLTALRAGDELCSSVSAAGDVNGDGMGDLVVGGDGADQAYVVFGSTQPFPPVFPVSLLLADAGGDGTRGFVLNGLPRMDHENFTQGNGVSRAGDVNGDGVDDLIVGADDSDYGTEGKQGVSFVLFGSTEPFPAVSNINRLRPDQGGDGTLGFAVIGVVRAEYSGTTVGGVGDVNGDGIDDFIVGAPYESPGPGLRRGQAYVIFGSTAPFAPLFALADLLPDGGGDGSRGFVITGFGQERLLGIAVSSAGDVNADGATDLIVGAPGSDAAYVILGHAAAR
jgi:hypothetical protein